MAKIPMNLLGSCVIRDALEFSQQAKANVTIPHFFQSNSPITLGTAKLSEIVAHNLNESDFSQTHPVWYRWFMANAEETVYDTLADGSSPYLLTSLDECAYGYHVFKKDRLEARLCPSMAIDRNDIFKKIDHAHATINAFNADKETFNLMERHCQKLRDLYDPHKIILLKFYPAQYYVENHKLQTFTSTDGQRNLMNLLDKFYAIFQNILPESQQISLPATLLGDPNHKWGKGARHFHPEIYTFIAHAILEMAGCPVPGSSTNPDSLAEKIRIIMQDAM